MTRDVPDYALLYRNPVVVHGGVCECGEKLGEVLRCAACGMGYDNGDIFESMVVRCLLCRRKG